MLRQGNARLRQCFGEAKKNMENETKSKKDYFLPISIVLAAVIIAFAVLYTSGKPADDNSTGISEDEKSISIAEGDYILGNENAEITMFEFSDYECPACAAFHSQIRPLILSSFIEGGKVKSVFRDLAYHEDSLFLSNSVWCAGEQDVFWEIHDFVFGKEYSDGEAPTKEVLVEEINNLGLSGQEFSKCLDEGKYNQVVIDKTKEGREMSMLATPITVVVKGDAFSASPKYVYDELKKVLDGISTSPVIPISNGVLIVGIQPFDVFQSEINNLLGE